MNYFKYIKSAFDNRAVRAALITLPPAALMFYLARSHKNGAPIITGTTDSSNFRKKDANHTINSGLPEPNENVPEVLDVDNLSLEKSVEILDQDPLTGEVVDYGECIAISAKGTRCKRKAVDSSRFCWQHKKLAPNGNT